MTGRGEGYCVLELREPGQPSRGYAGLQGVPVSLEPPAAELGQLSSVTAWPFATFGRPWGRAARRGRGRHFLRR
jgi:hypothetical protein